MKNRNIALCCTGAGILTLLVAIVIGGIAGRTPDVTVESDIPISPTLSPEERAKVDAVRYELQLQRDAEADLNARTSHGMIATEEGWINVHEQEAAKLEAENKALKAKASELVKIAKSPQQLMELRIRRSDHCVIYTIPLGGHNYLANTCGGLILMPE